MRIILPLAIFLFFYSTNVKAQFALSFQGGFSYNKYKGKQMSGTNVTGKEGYLFSCAAVRPLGSNLNISASTMLIQKNITVNISDVIFHNIKTTYFQVPIGLESKHKLIGGLTMSGFVGVFFAYGINRTREGVVPNFFDVSLDDEGRETIKLEHFKSKYPFAKKTSHKGEFGWAANASLTHILTENSEVSLTGHYYRSQTSLEKRTNSLITGVYNTTSALTIGIIHHF